MGVVVSQAGRVVKAKALRQHCLARGGGWSAWEE